MEIISKHKKIKVLNFNIVKRTYHGSIFETLLINDEFLVVGDDYISFVCSSCGQEIIEQYRRNKKFHSISNKILCRKCANKQTCLEKYGIKNGGGSKFSIEKSKKHFTEKFGVQNPFQSEKIKEKIKSLKIERYGDANYSNREKAKSTTIKNYGVECPFQSDSIKEKAKSTNIKKYGTEYSTQNALIKKKTELTNMRKYGVKHIMQRKDLKEKAESTNIKRYGVKHPFQSALIREKAKLTNIKKYGVEYPVQDATFCAKMINNQTNGYKYRIYNGLYYLSKKELDFIKLCKNNKICIKNGPTIKYNWNNKDRYYHIDFELEKFLVEIKARHHWYKEDLRSGKLEAKNVAARNHANTLNKQFIFILEDNMIDIAQKLKKEYE